MLKLYSILFDQRLSVLKHDGKCCKFNTLPWRIRYHFIGRIKLYTSIIFVITVPNKFRINMSRDYFIRWKSYDWLHGWQTQKKKCRNWDILRYYISFKERKSGLYDFEWKYSQMKIYRVFTLHGEHFFKVKKKALIVISFKYQNHPNCKIVSRIND